MASAPEEGDFNEPESKLVDIVIAPAVKAAGDAFLSTLDTYTVEDLCNKADDSRVFSAETAIAVDFAI